MPGDQRPFITCGEEIRQRGLNFCMFKNLNSSKSQGSCEFSETSQFMPAAHSCSTPELYWPSKRRVCLRDT